MRGPNLGTTSETGPFYCRRVQWSRRPVSGVHGAGRSRERHGERAGLLVNRLLDLVSENVSNNLNVVSEMCALVNGC